MADLLLSRAIFGTSQQSSNSLSPREVIANKNIAFSFEQMVLFIEAKRVPLCQIAIKGPEANMT